MSAWASCKSGLMESHKSLPIKDLQFILRNAFLLFGTMIATQNLRASRPPERRPTTVVISGHPGGCRWSKAVV